MRWFVLLFLVPLLAACSAAGGYRRLAADMEGYHPPPLAEASPTATPAVPATGDGFAGEVVRLAERKQRWEEAVKATGGFPRFLAPEPALMASLEPAARDAGAAARSLADGFTLETLEVLTLLRHRGVAGTAEELRATLEAYSQVTGVDEILRRYSAFTESLMTGIGDMEERESPSMKFPFPGVLALKGDIVTREAAIAREALEAARKEAITAARRTFWELLYNVRAREVTAESLTLLAQMEDSARSRYESGKGSLLDVVRAQVESEKMREESRTLAEEGRNLRAALRRLADLPSDAPVGTPADREPPREVPQVETMTARALERSQVLRTMRAEIERMELMIEMAETEIFPPLTFNLSIYDDKAALQAGTMRMEEPFAATTTSGMGAGLPRNAWFASGDAYLRETRQRLAGMRARLADEERAVALMVREGWFTFDRARREESLNGSRLAELYALAADSSLRAYETGMMPIRGAIEFAMSRLAATLAASRSRSDLGIARAELESAVGASLEQLETAER